jgi:DNA-binding HxlR family transcriptional regulator
MVFAAKIIGDVWTLMIVKQLLTGKKRFKDLELALDGVSTKTLCARLTMLEENHLITRKYFSEIPPRVEYELSEVGKQLDRVIEEIESFGKIMKV